jgi:hypothetical protein
MRKAEEADSKPLEDGLTIPEEIKRRDDRKAALEEAKGVMEARRRGRNGKRSGIRGKRGRKRRGNR